MSNLNPKYNQFKSFNTVKVVKKKDFEIKEDEFPDLSAPVKNNYNNVKSFSFLLKEKTTNKVEETNEYIVPQGWSYYKYTKFSNGLCDSKYSKLTTKIQEPFINKNYEIIKEKIVLNEAEEIINALSLLHEKRTNNYKELWGETEWEQMFICPNYDYEYFDKLDKAYEIEESKLDDQYYNDNNEESDNY